MSLVYLFLLPVVGGGGGDSGDGGGNGVGGDDGTGNGSTIVGTWVGEPEECNTTATVVFNEDGTFTFSADDGAQVNGTYTYDGGTELPYTVLYTNATGCAPSEVDSGTMTVTLSGDTLTITSEGPTGTYTRQSGNGNGGDISMITPYVNESDMVSINEAFSSSDNAPWGFAHDGIDFFPNGDLKPFQAISSGVVDEVRLWQNGTNWQVNVRIIYNSTYSVEYGFEPMTAVQADGETRLQGQTYILHFTDLFPLLKPFHGIERSYL